MFRRPDDRVLLLNLLSLGPAKAKQHVDHKSIMTTGLYAEVQLARMIVGLLQVVQLGRKKTQPYALSNTRRQTCLMYIPGPSPLGTVVAGKVRGC